MIWKKIWIVVIVGLLAGSGCQATQTGSDRSVERAERGEFAAGQESRKSKKKRRPSAGDRRRGPRLDGQVRMREIDRETKCAISRRWDCDIGIAKRRGLIETGLRPEFPKGVDCRNIDEHWAISLSHKRGHENYHGGIDVPAPVGTPIVAAAAGTVVAIFEGEKTNRGIDIILRHSPDDTGIPLWIYTQYTHFDKMPALKRGQRVHMGQVLGPTGNSGASNARRERRPAIHFGVWFSKSPKYAVGRGRLMPVDGQWMDPNALYRGKPPFDSHSMKDLPAERKRIRIPVVMKDGSTIPPGTKLVWPYACDRRGVPTQASAP